MKKLFQLLTLTVTSFLLPQDGWSQVLQSCDQWANTSVSGYNIYNNIWGSGAGSQCMTAYSYNDWYVDANHSGGGIKSYPNSEWQLNVNVDNMGAITSSFNVSRPGGGAYSSTYDIWYDDYAYEIMLWMNYNGSLGPISYNYGCSGYPSTACPEATNVNVGGHTWNVYRGNNGGNEVFSFIRTSNTNSGTVDITAISQWLRNNGWFGNANLHSIQFGFEITSTNGTQRYEVNNYSVSVNSGGGGGTTYYQLRNRGTGLYLDGMGLTSNGSAAGQYANTSHVNAQWEMIGQGGNYYQLRNRGTGLYLDGMGRTSDGADCGQWANTSHQNSHWNVTQYSGNYYRLQNRTTGLYLDGMGRTSNGANCGQWPNTTHPNAQWELIALSGSRVAEEVADRFLADKVSFYPNPMLDHLNIQLEENETQAQAKIFNLSGQLIISQDLSAIRSELDVSELKRGVYFLELHTSADTQRAKLIKK